MGIVDDMDDTYYVRAWSLIGFDHLVKSKGGNPIEMIEEVGIDPRALDDPDMLIPFAGKGVLLELAARKLGEPALGLEWAMTAPGHFPDTGPVLLLTEGTPTFRDWLKRSMQYWRLQASALTGEQVYYEDLKAVGLQIGRSGPLRILPQHMENLIGKIVRLTRVVLNEEVDPLKVSFRHARPRDTTLHDLVFRCPVEFGASRDEIVFERDILHRPVIGRAGETEAIANEFLRDRIALLSRYRPSVTTSTTLAIKTVLGAGICSKDFIARALGCSPKKLQRLLAGEGTTYEEILDNVRREVGCALLAGSNAPIAAIGSMLDFASPAAMTLAMRRWTGMTPSDYRENAQLAVRAEVA